MHQPAPVLSKVSMKAEQRTRNSLHSLMYREFFEEISGGYPIALPSSSAAILNKTNTYPHSDKLTTSD